MMDQSKKHVPFFIVGSIILLLLIAGGVGFFFYRNYQKEQEKLKNSADLSKQEALELIDKVGKMLLLPSEEPQIAMVADIEQLKDQPFFANAQNGDRVLLYLEAKKAILYRPDSNMIIEVAPLTVNDASASGASPVAVTLGNGRQLTVSIRNGTGVTGLTKTLEEELVTRITNVSVSERDNAKRHFTQTSVIDVSGINGSAVSELATILGATVSGLPVGETKPSSDILIIIGKDRIPTFPLNN